MGSVVEILIRAKDEASAQIGKLDKSVKDLAASGAVMAGAGLAMGAAMLAMGNKAAEAGDDALEAAQRLGTTTQAIAGLKLIAGQSGTSFEALSTGMGKLAKDATSGGEKLKDLGISIVDSSGRVKPMNTLLGEAADKFAGMKDGTVKTALAIDLFGRSGAELIPVLNGGSAALNEAAEKAAKYHTAIGPEAAAAGDRFKDSQADLRESLDGLALTIGTALVPAMTSIVEALTPVVVGISDFVAEHPKAIELVGALSAALVVAGGVLMGMAITSLPAVEAALLAVGGSVVIATGGIALLVAAAFTFRREIASVAADIAGMFLGAMEKLIGAAEAVAVAMGLGGMVGTMEIARKKLLEMREVTDKYKVSVLDTTDVVGDHERALGKKTKAQVDATIEDKKATEALKKTAEAQEKLNKAVYDAGEFWKKAERDATAEIEKNFQLTLSLNELRMKREEANKAAERTAQINELSVQSTGLLLQGINDLTAGLKPLTDGLSSEMAVQVAVKKSVDDSNAAMGISVDLIADVTGARREDIIAAREHAGEQDKVAQAAQAAAEQYQRVWETAAGAMSAGLGKAFTDALFHGGNFKNSMIGLLKETGEGMFQSIITGFITPFTTHLAGIGTKLSSVLSGALGVGGGGGAATTIPGAAAIPGAAPGGGSAVAGLLTNPWTIAIGAGIAGAMAWLKSQAHHEANTLVKDIENPFWAAWGQILPSDKPEDLIALDPDKAAAIGANLATMNANYLSLISEFSKGGKDEELVSNQSLANTQPHYNELIAALRASVINGGRIPQFRRGVEYLNRDTLGYLHQGEAVLTKEQNAARLAGSGGASAEVCALLRELITATRQGLSIDGTRLTRAVATKLNNFERFDGVSIGGF
jgi:hypothetical protein